MSKMTWFVGAMVLALCFVGACGPTEEETRAEEESQEWSILQEEGAALTAQREDLNTIREEITAYEPGRGYEVEIVDPGKFPLKRAVAHLSVEPLGDARSRVGFDMDFRPKFGPLGWIMGKTVMVPQFRKILGRVLEGLETHLRTGEVVSRKPRPTVAAQA